MRIIFATTKDIDTPVVFDGSNVNSNLYNLVLAVKLISIIYLAHYLGR